MYTKVVIFRLELTAFGLPIPVGKKEGRWPLAERENRRPKATGQSGRQGNRAGRLTEPIAVFRSPSLVVTGLDVESIDERVQLGFDRAETALHADFQ